MNNFNLCGGGFPAFGNHHDKPFDGGGFPAFGNHHDKPFDGEQKGLCKIFYKSDFSVWLADPTGDKTTPFTLTFYVGDLESTYTAGFDGLDYKRCKRNEDGSLLVFFDRHALPCGRLMLRVEIDKVNPYYADGEQNTADKLPLPIILWDGATSYEPTMAYALAPYIVGADGKPFTYEDLTDEQKAELFEKATKDFAATVQRSYTAADKDEMEAIADPKEGDVCVLESGENYTYHNGEWVLLTDPITAEEVTDIVDGKISDLLDGAPETMDTLKEVADAIAANKNVGDALTAAIGNKVNKEDGKGLSTNDYTDEDKAKLDGVSNAQRTYTAADKDAMEAITDTKEGDICRCPAVLEINVSEIKKGEVINKITAIDATKADAFNSYLTAGGESWYSFWFDDYDGLIMAFYPQTSGLKMTLSDSNNVIDGAAWSDDGELNAFIERFNSQPIAWHKVAHINFPPELPTLGGESPVTVEVQRESTYTYHDGAWVLQTEKADAASTPALLTAADADAMNALTTAKDGDRCIVGGNAIYDRVGGTWYFTAGVQPVRTVKASELKAGDKIKTVNFDTSKTPEGTGDGIFCTIGGVPIEMMAFIDSLSYGTGKTPLFTGTWNTTNTAACSAAMAGKTVDSVAASMAALSANVDDWLSFEIE